VAEAGLVPHQFHSGEMKGEATSVEATGAARLRWFLEAVVVVAPVAAVLQDPSHEEMAVEPRNERNELAARMEAEAAKQRGKAKGMGVVVLAMGEQLPYMKNGKIPLSLP